MVQRTSFYPLRGGMDLITPPVELSPGRAIAGLNYEPFERGYRRCDGYERFDGQPKPSAASYWILQFENATAAISEGDVVTGTLSGSSGRALLDGVLESGSYGAGTGAGYVVLTAIDAAEIEESFLTPGSLPTGYTLTRAGSATYLDSNGDLQIAGTNVARWGYYWTGAAWAIAGLIYDGGRRNELRNNTMVGASAGTPGTLPTNWEVSNAVGVTQVIVGTGTEDNIEYMDIRFHGSPSSTGYIGLRMEGQTAIATTKGDEWAFSAFLRATAGNFTNISLAALRITTRDASVALATEDTDFRSTVTSAALSRQRLSVVTTIGESGSTLYAVPAIIIGVTSGQAMDVTLRIGLPQLERDKPFSTPIRTSGAAVTTADDVFTRAFPVAVTADIEIERLAYGSATIITNNLTAQSTGTTYTMPGGARPLRVIRFTNLVADEDADFIFATGEELTVSGSPVADAVAPATERGAADAEDDTTWFQAAIEDARDLIEAVPGSGPVRGVWVYQGNKYAIRDDVDGTVGVLHKATASGWESQNLGYRLLFDAGSTEFEEGETITGATSGTTAVVRRLILSTGTFAGSNATGTLLISDLNGSFEDNEALSGAGVATVNGVQTPKEIPAGGHYRFVNHNFFGLSDRLRMYAVNGVGRAFEWDGNVHVGINTGLSDALDKPTHIAVHQNALFLGFRGGSLQNSAIGEPTTWSVVQGASEIGLGAEITALVSGVAGVLPVLGSDKISVLYGADSDEYRLDTFANDAGAYEHSVQIVGAPIFCDARGLRSLVQSDTFGNFARGSISRDVEPLFKFKLGGGARPVASLRVRAKDQYRLFWDDGPTGVTVYLGREVPEIMPFELLHAPTCMCSGEDEDGNEILLMGSDDGFVYQLDSGTSFDGEAIRAYVRFPFNHLGSPTQKKRWHKATLEIDAAPTSTIGFTTEFSYGDPDSPAAAEQSFQTFSVAGGGGFWEEASWDQFFWSSPAVGLAQAHISGIGQNMSLTVFSEQIYEEPHAVTGVTLHFSYRGMVR